MSVSVCYYHSERQAVDKCERCNRMICLEDKIKKTYTRSVGTGDSSGYVSYQVIVCPLCDMNQELKARNNIFNPASLILSAIFIIFPFIMGMLFLGISYMIINSELNPDPAFAFAQTNGPNYFIILFMIPFILAGLGLGIVFPYFMIRKARKTIKENPDKIQELENRKRKFFDSVTSPEARKQIELSKYQNSMSCFQCGAKIFPHEQFCSNCGDSTKDEFRVKA